MKHTSQPQVLNFQESIKNPIMQFPTVSGQANFLRDFIPSNNHQSISDLLSKTHNI